MGLEETVAQNQIQRVFDRVNNYLSFAEMALLDFHRYTVQFAVVLQRWLKNEILMSDEERIVSEFLRSFSTMRYWLLMSYEFLEYLGYASSIEEEDIQLLMLTDAAKSIDKADGYRKVFIKLQTEFERYCREQGIV